MGETATDLTGNRLQLVRVLQAIAQATFALFFVLLLGANSVAADGGPLTWLPLLRLPVAGGGWESIGPVALLPFFSALAWLGGRRLGVAPAPFSFGWPRLTWPGVAIGLLALGRVALACAQGECSAGSLFRLLILLALGAWTYLYIVNEQPDLLWVAAPVILLQSFTGMAQFYLQSDLGWQFLGERALDPAVSGVSIVWRDEARWLRGYGLTGHPNILARTLVPFLLTLPILARGATTRRRRLLGAVFLVGIGGMLVTLSRWAWACLLLGLVINALPYAIQSVRGRAWAFPRPAVVTLGTSAVLIALFLTVYGDTVAGRAAVTTTATEAMSVGERQRDLAIGWALVRSTPVLGVGYEQYLPAASELDPAADIVHTVPLWWAAELGVMGAALWLVLVVAPLWRPGVLGRHAPYTALWLGFWLLGMLYTGPNPLIEIRSMLMAGLVAGVVALSDSSRVQSER